MKHLRRRLFFATAGVVGVLLVVLNVWMMASVQKYYPAVLMLALPVAWGGIFFALHPEPPGKVGPPPKWWFLGGPVACALLLLLGMLFVAVNW